MTAHGRRGRAALVALLALVTLPASAALSTDSASPADETPPKVSRVIKSFMPAEAAVPAIDAITKKDKSCKPANVLWLNPRHSAGTLNWKRWDLENHNKFGRITLDVVREEDVPGQRFYGQRQYFEVKYATKRRKATSAVCAIFAATAKRGIEFLEASSSSSAGVRVVDPVQMFDPSRDYIEMLYVYMRPRR